MVIKCTSVQPSSTAELMCRYNATYIARWREFMATQEANGRRHWASICTVLPRRTTGFACRQKNEEKASYLPAVSLAVAVRRYDTKRIARWRGTRATPEATGCCHRASIAADRMNRSRKSRFFLSFFHHRPAEKGTRVMSRPQITIGV
jgi:hypothetical protein